MGVPFEFFEHTADIGVHVFGADLPELFANAARAMFAALGELKKSEAECRTSMELTAESLEDLLHDWLTELLFEVETRHVLYDEPGLLEGEAPSEPRLAGRLALQVNCDEAHRCYRLTATLAGRTIDFSKSQTREEIKAVTYHRLRVEQLPDGSWRACVIFDV